MRANRAESSLERRLRSELHRRGLRFRKQYRPVGGLRCTADIAFPRRRIAVFVDGCFWHRCPIHATKPRTNAEWWERKLGANVARDHRNDVVLKDHGWLVIRFWEHEPLGEMADRIQAEVHRSTPGIRRDGALALGPNEAAQP